MVQGSPRWFARGFDTKVLTKVLTPGCGSRDGLAGRVSESLCVGHNMRSCLCLASTANDRRALEPVPSEILDHFVGQGPITAEELETTVRRFKKAVIERALGGELTHHLG